jgi:hypothetical protein
MACTMFSTFGQVRVCFRCSPEHHVDYFLIESCVRRRTGDRQNHYCRDSVLGDHEGATSQPAVRAARLSEILVIIPSSH